MNQLMNEAGGGGGRRGRRTTGDREGDREEGEPRRRTHAAMVRHDHIHDTFEKEHTREQDTHERKHVRVLSLTGARERERDCGRGPTRL